MSDALSPEALERYFSPIVKDPPPKPKRPTAKSRGFVARDLERAAEIGLDLEEISFRNSVEFFKEELLRIRGHVKAKVSENNIRSLRRLGLIEIQTPRNYVRLLTPRAEAELRRLEEEGRI